MIDRDYMNRALELAKLGVGWTNPNPVVGAVIVKDGKIIGEGYHEFFGEAHAERKAFSSCTEAPNGATLYVTLEPCCHFGKTPPCTEAILESGIRKVVIGSRDPNPEVSGKGIARMRGAGIEVIEGFMKHECDSINTVFFHYITTGLPYVAMKYAMTVDGKIATATGASKWITGEVAREHVHTLRHRYSGIMVGIGTVLADDPMLDCRMESGKNPVRIICDSSLRLPLNSQLCQTASEINTIVATAVVSAYKRVELESYGITVMEIPDLHGKVDLPKLMELLGKMGIDSILMEGGSTLNFRALEAGIIDKVYAYIAPKLFGGEGAKTPVGGIGVTLPEQSFQLSSPKITMHGEDLLLEYDVIKEK